MDRLCDDVIDEVLLRLPLKHLHRLRAVSRRYNALVLRPVFAVRYWSTHGPHLSGVFLQSETLLRTWGRRPCFLTAPGRGRPRPPAAESVLASDLGFMPQMQTCCRAASKDMIFVVHSACGPLLCRRGKEKPVHYYVCNPVTWQCVALPELPWPPEDGCSHTGLLTLAADGHGYVRSFKVVLVSHASRWHRGGAPLGLKVFSSETGQWRALEESALSWSLKLEGIFYPTFLGQSGNAYWIASSSSGFPSKYVAIAYNSFSNFVLELPELPTRVTPAYGGKNRCLGERRDGGVRYAHFDTSVFEVWDLVWDLQAGALWKLVHRADVMELAATNPEATSAVTTCSEAVANLMMRNDLFNLLGFHPTEDDVVYFDAGRNVAAYSMDRREITIQSPRQCFTWDVFPYAHPPFPVLIPEINNSKLMAPPELNH